ncbi:hypothetical protein [Spirosoma sp.]|uniref:hypothetical protein n=1 Tax=Spirosoma sp. TaxID=1899569 RepID=UPI002624141E|nr:hypothetical protein [Spirosoma sp.]MCX6218344.1 hypothetical protein [Spirosoma sp.]
MNKPTTTRAKAVTVVTTISQTTGEARYRVWHRVYSRLQLLYGVNLNAHPRQAGESLISVAERFGYIEELYAVVLAEWIFSEAVEA